MLKPWKCKVSQLITVDALLNPYLKKKTATQSIFQGGTPWVTQILNNVIVSMVPYCTKKKWGDVVLDLKGKSIESRLMSIEILT